MADRPPVFEPRVVCERCKRPTGFCWCPHLTTLDTKTRIILLQHPRERDVAIGTARMASLCLPNSELHVGIRWRDDPALTRALSDPDRPAALLYPGKGSIDVAANPPAGPITLVVVDGTWWQSKKLIRENPELAALPRYAFTPDVPSEYRIRKEPDAAYVSTIEALVHVLGALEGDRARFRALLVPFRAMIDAQIGCQETIRASRQKKRVRKPKPPRSHVPMCVRDPARDVVCVVAEANAWPHRSSEREGWPDELVHLTAHRISTGETFECIVAPENPLAPNTAAHTRLSAEALATGTTRGAMREQWRAFVRDADVLCCWGRYATSMLRSSGGMLPATCIDLRRVAREEGHTGEGGFGTIDDYMSRIPGPAPEALARGRAGIRLAQIARVVRHFRGET